MKKECLALRSCVERLQMELFTGILVYARLVSFFVLVVCLSGTISIIDWILTLLIFMFLEFLAVFHLAHYVASLLP